MEIEIKEIGISTKDIEVCDDRDKLIFYKNEISVLLAILSNEILAFKNKYTQGIISACELDSFRRVKLKKKLYKISIDFINTRLGKLREEIKNQNRIIFSRDLQWKEKLKNHSERMDFECSFWRAKTKEIATTDQMELFYEELENKRKGS